MMADVSTTSHATTILAAVISGMGSFIITATISWWKGRGQLQRDVAEIKEQVFSNGGSSLRDVCNRIEEQQLIDGELRRAYQQHVNVPFWEADPEGQIIWCNGAFAKLLGVATEDLKGHGWMSMVNRDDLPKVRHEILQSGSHDHHIDYRAHRPSPQGMVTIKTRWRRVANHAGKTVRFVGTVLSHEEVKR